MHLDGVSITIPLIIVSRIHMVIIIMITILIIISFVVTIAENREASPHETDGAESPTSRIFQSPHNQFSSIFDTNDDEDDGDGDKGEDEDYGDDDQFSSVCGVPENQNGPIRCESITHMIIWELDMMMI